MKRNNSSKRKAGKKSKKQKEEFFVDEVEPEEIKKTPEDQLGLTDAQLDEEFTKTLTSVDPNKPQKLTSFHYNEGIYKSVGNQDHLGTTYTVSGNIWHAQEIEKLEKEQQEHEQEQNADADAPVEDDQNENAEDTEQPPDGAAEADGGGAEAAAGDAAEAADPAADGIEEKPDEEQQEAEQSDKENNDEQDTKTAKRTKLVKNQFNYSERASQTFNQPLRDREIQTEPAPTFVFSQNANPWAIRDEYLNNLIRQKKQQEKEKNKGKGVSSKPKSLLSGSNTDSSSKITHFDETDQLLHSSELLNSIKITERVIGLNSASQSYHSFRYYKHEDVVSKIPYLLHLWTFRYGQCKKKMVTSLAWNPSHEDLFAVGYGSYDFHKQTSGMICIFTLKSTAYPEKSITVESGVMSMHWHPKHSSLLCVGSYDGSVAVYDVRNRGDTPIYTSENPELFHTDPVWDISWQHDEFEHELNFFSISSDGLLANWTLSKNELKHEIVMRLKSASDSLEDGSDDEMTALSLASVTCFDFHPLTNHVFLVGTEDGTIFQASKTYTDRYIMTYKSHNMNVYAVKWNPFHPTTFISASADCTIQLWDSNEPNPIITYDLGSSVGDLCWAPFSATIFAAVTSDGKAHVFDLFQNKNMPMCSDKITKKGSLTHVAFGNTDPVIIVGDEKGVTYCLKLSPALFLSNNQAIDKDKEKSKIDKVLKVTGNKVLNLKLVKSPEKNAN